ncbi:leucine-rich repeat protein [Faecalicoccus acidiformans]|uniref:leucine-rich repeat protein n=1 Tax=Faecalicoccus acidiformans TaxID=915173 RepID=UPI0025A35507|nr:leucine-rich repeat protein [Faecalicoccus acidiformans]MDM8203674.1 leucine-rich repeat protein [Faecalicoccus acidiformans]
MKKIFTCALVLALGITQISPALALETESEQIQDEGITTNENEGSNQSPDASINSIQQESTDISQKTIESEEVSEQENTITESSQDDFVIENGVLTAYNGNDSHVVIPEGVTVIADHVFEYNKSIQSVSFPQSLDEIGFMAFKDSGLSGELILTENITRIGIGAFSFCNFSTVFVPAREDFPIFGIGGFLATNIDKVVFEDGSIYAPGGLFSAANVKEIAFPDSMIEIEEEAFDDNPNLTELALPNNLQIISINAFSDCTSLSEINLPDSVTTLGKESFRNCTNVKKVVISSSLKDVVGYDDPTVQLGGPFENCTSLKEVVFREGIQIIPNLMFSGTGIEEIEIPDTVTVIEEGAFKNCVNLDKVTIPVSVTTIEDNVFEGSNRVTIYCREGSAAHKYAIENDIPFILDDHTHEFGNWVVTKKATCIKDGLKKRTCSCGVFEEQVIDALGHDFSEEWTIDKEPTCTEEGWRSHHCTRCDQTTDGEKMNKLDHSYGEWVIEKEATYYNEGKRYRICEHCQNKEEEIIPILKPDFEAHPDYSFAEFEVVDAQNLNTIEGALIKLSNGKDTFQTMTNDEGKAKVFVPHGSYDIVVSKEGYMDRSFTYTLETGEVSLPQIGISTGSVVTGELTVTEMSRDEILEAGIDVNDPDNQHVFKYEVTLKFSDGLEIYTIPSVIFKNNKGESIKSYFGDESNTGNVFVIDAPEKITITKVSEYLYIVVQGQTKWLKEMFHVQLVVVNTSLTDKLVDCTAELQLPSGLSLADLSTGEQSNQQIIESVDRGQSESLDWYIRGDQTGDYEISATLKGEFSSFHDPFEYTFKTQDPLHVYAGTDMQLTVHCSDAAYYGEPYTMIFELENVSDHTIYDVRHQIKNVSQYQVKKYTWVEDGKVVDEEEGWNTLDSQNLGLDGIVLKDEFKPGEKLAVLVKTDVLWKSPLHRFKESASTLQTILKLGGLSGNAMSTLFSAISFVDVRYYLTDTLVSYADENTTQIPITFDIEHRAGVSIYDKLFEEALGKYFGKLESGAVHVMTQGGLDNYFSMIKKMQKKVQLQSSDSNTEVLAWVEDADGSSNVISIQADGATLDDQGRLVLKGDSEISVNALNTGQAYLLIQDSQGNITKHQFNVHESFPGQETITSEIEDLFYLPFLVVPYGQTLSEEMSTFLNELGCQLMYDNAPLKIGDSIPTGAVILDENGNEVLSTMLPGDSNSDAQVNLFDGYHILNMKNQKSLTQMQLAASNYNGDGAADEKDTTYLFNFLTQQDLTTYSLPGIEQSAYQVDLQNMLQGLENVKGIQLDIDHVSNSGMENAAVKVNAKADFNQTAYNQSQDRIRAIVANYDSLLPISKTSLEVLMNSTQDKVSIPARIYIQTDTEEITRDITLTLNKVTGDSENDFQQTVDRFEDTLKEVENALESLEGYDSIKSDFLTIIDQIKEKLQKAQSVEEIQELQKQLENAYAQFQKNLKEQQTQESQNSSESTSDKKKDESENQDSKEKKNSANTGVKIGDTLLFFVLSTVSLLIIILIRKRTT